MVFFEKSKISSDINFKMLKVFSHLAWELLAFSHNSLMKVFQSDWSSYFTIETIVELILVSKA